MSARRRSIRSRLIATTALSSSLALLLACGAFLTYEFLTFRHALIEDLTASARVLASGLSAPMIFDDPGAAKTTLAPLKANPRIRSAVVTRPNGERFAVYGNPSATSEDTAMDPQSGMRYRFQGNRVLVTVPVLSEKASIGTLTLESSMEELMQRVRRYLLLTGAILLVSLLAGLLLSYRMQRWLISPIQVLTRSAEQVTRNHDYSVRVSLPNEDELGLLGGTFNEMLEQIQQQNAELERSVRMRDEFLSVASHELKTPLTPLLLQVQTLGRQLARDKESPLAPKVEVLDRQVRRVAKLVDDLLDISRLSTRREMELDNEPLDLAALVEDVAERFHPEAARNGTVLTVKTEGPVPGVWDAMRLEQVLVNLLANALKYGPGAPVDLTVKSTAGRAVVEVRDHGIGIAREDLKRIFGRFERAVSDRHYGGFGLGLWIVREILGAMGGTIEVESEPGKGSLFTVELPLSPSSAPQLHEQH